MTKPASIRKRRARRAEAAARGDGEQFAAVQRVRMCASAVIVNRVPFTADLFRLRAVLVRDLKHAVNAARNFRPAPGTKARDAIDSGRDVLRSLSGNAFSGWFINTRDVVRLTDAGIGMDGDA